MTRWPRTADDALTVIMLMLLAGTYVQALVNVVAWSSSWSWLGGASASVLVSVLHQFIDVLIALIVPLLVALLLRLPLTAAAGALVALPAGLWPVPSLLMDDAMGDPFLWVALVNCAITLLVPVGVFAALGHLNGGHAARSQEQQDVYEPGC